MGMVLLQFILIFLFQCLLSGSTKYTASWCVKRFKGAQASYRCAENLE